MPLTQSGDQVLASMKSTYGDEKGTRVFYASLDKGKPGSAKWHRQALLPATPSAPRALAKGRR